MDFVKQAWSPYTQKKAFDLGLGGHSNYSKFIIVGRSRVGSNLLRGLLNSHPQIITFGEVFRDRSSLDWDHMGYFQSSRMLRRLQKDAVQFVEARVFGRYPRSVSAVGFKLFYYHAQEGQAAAIWTYLKGRRDVRIIHLKRRNILQTHLSRKRAAMTNSWVNTSERRNGLSSVELDPAECIEDFTRTRAWEEQFDRFFENHPKLEILYEDLAQSYQEELKRVQDFLEVEQRPVHPSTFKQADQSLSKAIANYRELKERFIGTPWEPFFVE